MKGFLNLVRQLQANDWVFLEITEKTLRSNASQCNIHFDMNVRRLHIKTNLYCIYVLWNNEPIEQTSPLINKKIRLNLNPNVQFPIHINKILMNPLGLNEAYILSKARYRKLIREELNRSTFTWATTDDYWNNWQKAVGQRHNG